METTIDAKRQQNSLEKHVAKLCFIHRRRGRQLLDGMSCNEQNGSKLTGATMHRTIPNRHMSTQVLTCFLMPFACSAHHESSEVPTRVEEPLHTERKFIVFESCLRELLTTCKVCGQAVGDISSKVVGTLLIVEGMCDKEHMLQWRSQPLVRGSGAGNILLAAGVLFSGCAVAATLRCLNSIGVQTITERTFYNYQRAYLLLAINAVHHCATFTKN